MKNTFKYLLGTLALAGTMVACSPEEFDHMSEDGIIDAVGFGQQIDVQVDQTTNQVTFTLNGAKEIYPVWELDLGKGKTEVSTVNGYKRILTLSGDYTVRCHIGNKHGISTSYVDYKFHINNSIVDFTKYTTMLSKAPWYIDNTAKGHLGCGESGTEGTNWWSANPDEKAAFGVYDNALTFTTDMKYTFDPGAAGTLYANWGVTSNDWQATYWSGVENEDFNVPVELQNTTYNFEVDGEDLYLTFPKGTYFPYIANDDIWNTPRYLVVNMTAKQMTLRIDNGGIAWQFILTTQHEVKEVFNGFTYDQPDNLWKQMEVKAGGIYYADAGWAAYPDNGGATFEVSNAETKVVLPLATASQWQAQFPIHTNVGPGSPLMTSAKNYDFSCVVSSNKDLKGMTFKLVETGDNGVPGSLGIAYDANAVFYNNETNLTAFEDYVFYVVDQPGVDIQDNLLQLVLDFGGCEEGTEITVKNIVLIEHALNKELDKLPGNDGPGKDDPAKPVVDWSGENLLAGMPVEITQYYAPGWAQLPDAEYTAENGTYTINYPSATTDQWQTQFTFNNTGIALDPEKTYDFRCKITSSTDHPGVTVKITQQDDDNTFITEGRHPLAAFEETWIELSDLKFVVNGEGKGVINNLKMPFDFGGIAAGTEIVISDMHLQEHKGPKTIAWDLTGEKNLWLKGEHETLSFYYAPGWAQIADPETEVDGNSYTIVLPEATTDQWQAQWHLGTILGSADIKADKKYDIRFTLYSDQDQPGVTFKFTENGNDENFLTADRHACAAYEETIVEIPGCSLSKGDITNPTFKVALDFAGNPAGSTVTIKDIIIQEAE